ncbi:MAG: tRNA (guanosine(37)-N1)-methyltransferase TrmD [Spirochaetes bacterium]|nr:tRNA (guanosine(37)-N1)-methyltransferase TrmD [Spirochaetota bacterium]
MKLFKIITLFPDFFESPLQSSLLGRAVRDLKIKVEIIDLKKFSSDKFHRCDDYSYGGGTGMVLQPEPLFRAIESGRKDNTKIILTSPAGMVYNQDIVKDFSKLDDICIICGHYEGLDQRVIDRYVDYEISIGDYIVSGGEYAALVILDSISRYIPGFMSNPDSLEQESFENNLLEYPQYTRPAEIDGYSVPDILLSGNHKKIREWRLQQAIDKTRKIRPDLYKKYLENNSRDTEKKE